MGDDSAASGSGYAVTPGIVVGDEYKTCQAPLTFDPATLDGVSKLSMQLTADPAKEGLFTHQGTASFLVPIFASTLVGSPCNGTTPRFSAPNAEVDVPVDLDAIAAAGGQMSFPLAGSVVSTGGATGTTERSGTLTIHVVEGGYTALGDSYSSGEGAGDYDEDSNSGKRSLPSLVARVAGARGAEAPAGAGPLCSGRAAVPASTTSCGPSVTPRKAPRSRPSLRR